MAWYREWFGNDYLELYAHRDAAEAERHIDFVTQHLTMRGHPFSVGDPDASSDGHPRRVLDLACGAGRHTAELRRRGYATVGIDLSLILLDHPPRVPSAEGDMRQLPFAADTFDWVLNFFTSFGYFERERENFQVLEEIARVLTDDGRFLIDFFNRDRALASLRARETQTIAGREVAIERWYDESSRRINKRMRLRDQAGGTRTYLESVRAYSEDEVTIGLRWAGLETDAVYGDFAGEPYQRETSERLIIVGHKS